MANDTDQSAYADQINAIVEGFMQLRLQFDVMLPRELAQLKSRINEIHPRSEYHRNANYDLFFRISNILYRKGNLTMGELSDALSVPPSTATRMVDWLVDSGYVQRLPDTEDRRVMWVSLTDTGRELHKTIESYLGQRFQQILFHLTDEERTSLITLISKVVSAVKRSAV